MAEDCSMWWKKVSEISLLLATIVVAQENTVEKIGWKGESSIIVTSVVSAFFSVLLVLLIFYLRTKVQSKKSKEQQSDRLYREYLEKAELNHHEIEKLGEITAHLNQTDRHLVFQSIAIFEQCVDLNVQKILNSAVLPQEQNDDELLLSNIRKKLGYNILPPEYPLASTRNIETGQNLSIYSSNSKPSSQGTHAIVVMNQQFIMRLKLEAKPADILFSNGDTVRIAFARQCDGIYGIDMKIQSFDGTASMDLLHTLTMKRNQLRQFLRIEVNLPVKIRVVKTVNADDKPLQGMQFEAKLVDISGGGLSFILDRPLVPGELISINLSLGSVVLAGQAGKVLRVSLIEAKTSTMYRHHITFTDIGPTMREKIVKYVFEKQRQLNQWR